MKRAEALRAVTEACFEEVKFLVTVYMRGLESPAKTHDEHLKHFLNGIAITKAAEAQAIIEITKAFEE